MVLLFFTVYAYVYLAIIRTDVCTRFSVLFYSVIDVVRKFIEYENGGMYYSKQWFKS